MADLGNAIHACIASAFTDREAQLSNGEVNDILIGFGAAEAVSSDAIVKHITALRGWIKERWGDVKASAEIPLESVLDNGQIVQGRVDLLLEKDDGRY